LAGWCDGFWAGWFDDFWTGWLDSFWIWWLDSFWTGLTTVFCDLSLVFWKGLTIGPNCRSEYGHLK